MSDATTSLGYDMPVAGWRQIADWLKDADVELAEISGSGWGVVMQRETGYLPQRATGTDQPSAPRKYLTTSTSRMVVVTAPVAGVFLDRHPLRQSPLLTSGAKVRKGDVVAFLRLGVVLAPVLAPVDGVHVKTLATTGALIGFGTELIQIYAGEV